MAKGRCLLGDWEGGISMYISMCIGMCMQCMYIHKLCIHVHSMVSGRLSMYISMCIHL